MPRSQGKDKNFVGVLARSGKAEVPNLNLDAPTGRIAESPIPNPHLHWGRSSVGRAPALQAGGRRFKPVRLHLGLARQ